jgi:hypothetical protein
VTPRTVSEAEALGEDLRDGDGTPPPGPLWRDAYAVTWPRSGGTGTCSHHAPDSCPRCDGTEAEARDAWKARRR